MVYCFALWVLTGDSVLEMGSCRQVGRSLGQETHSLVPWWRGLAPTHVIFSAVQGCVYGSW